MNEAPALRIGLVGGGRSRQGLGPYYATHAEAAGVRVQVVVGRDPARARIAAKELESRLGHPVEPLADLEALADRHLDAWIISSPVPTHLPALRAALAARVPVLCEKPLVEWEQHPQVPVLMQEFRDRGLLIQESCQWPMVLPALEQLFPGREFASVQEVKVLLSPAGQGREMMLDSLSHFLSILQALASVDENTVIHELGFTGAGSSVDDGLDLRLTLAGPEIRMAGELLLRQCPEQPRPAWIEVDGCRMARQIALPDYRISMATDDRTVPIDDPLAMLVYGFVRNAREVHSERVRTESLAIEHRARLYHQVIHALDQHFQS